MGTHKNGGRYPAYGPGGLVSIKAIRDFYAAKTLQQRSVEEIPTIPADGLQKEAA